MPGPAIFRAAPLREQGFVLPDDRSPAGLLGAVRDFFAPERIHLPLEQIETVRADDGQFYQRIATIESEARVINDGAIATGYRPMGVYLTIGTNWALRASYALRHTDSSADGRKAVAAWLGWPETEIWLTTLSPRNEHRRIDPAVTLVQAGFILPAQVPQASPRPKDQLDAWRKWSLVRAIAEWLFDDEPIMPFWDRREKWLDRVCANHPRPAALKRAFGDMANSRKPREVIAEWIGIDAEAIWPDHRARTDGSLTAAARLGAGGNG